MNFDAECLKDLQRFLRRDDPEKRPAFFTLSKTNIAKSDLVPLLSAYPDNKEIVFNSGEQQGLKSSDIGFSGSHAESWLIVLALLTTRFCAVKVATFLTMPIDTATEAVHQQVIVRLLHSTESSQSTAPKFTMDYSSEI